MIVPVILGGPERRPAVARSVGSETMQHSQSARVGHGVVSGTFSLDGQTYDVDNNIWVIGDDTECVVIDAPHNVDAIMAVVGDRTVRAIVCTHAHDDHVRVAPALRTRTGAPILLHPADRPLWELTHGAGVTWDTDLADGAEVEVAGTALTVLHTPGHAPGAVCLYAPDLACVFTGDTLFQGGPGATGRSYSDADLIVASIRSKLFALPPGTTVHTGHGADTTIDAERRHLDQP
jgi:glyoxylase-like metal-dependent hydrolase (beta-lactamase superfamily II)